MFDACKNLEAADQARFPRSVRVHIPRVLVSLYEIRNNRGVGHVGGDVNPNHMDATLVMESAKWILAELIRVFHDINTQEATEIVDALIDRTIPVIWEVGEVRRVLKTGLPMKLQTLLLLYSIPGSVPEGIFSNGLSILTLLSIAAMSYNPHIGNDYWNSTSSQAMFRFHLPELRTWKKTCRLLPKFTLGQ